MDESQINHNAEVYVGIELQPERICEDMSSVREVTDAMPLGE